MEFIRRAEIESLVNGSVVSEQLLFPENSKSERVTITRVTFAPGAKSPRHTHASSEQVMVALRGIGTLLLEGATTLPFAEGDVVRFADGDIHGFRKYGAKRVRVPCGHGAADQLPQRVRQQMARQRWRDSVTAPSTGKQADSVCNAVSLERQPSLNCCALETARRSR
jgi:quercetin dioxygenase-like cupin family protein